MARVKPIKFGEAFKDAAQSMKKPILMMPPPKVIAMDADPIEVEAQETSATPLLDAKLLAELEELMAETGAKKSGETKIRRIRQLGNWAENRRKK